MTETPNLEVKSDGDGYYGIYRKGTRQNVGVCVYVSFLDAVDEMERMAQKALRKAEIFND